MARFVPQPHHCAAPLHFVNGGILGTLIDCHCICTAIAAAYLDQGRPIGSAPELFLVTADMRLRYRRPTPISGPVDLAAQISDRLDNGYLVSCTLQVQGKVCVEGEVTAIQVSESWMKAQLSKDE